jgi:MinD-like ATPase involved in chromosome partitioning or flagellar assembly
VLAVAAGKGGVGKSTVAANLAQARRVVDYLVNKCLQHLCLSWST